MSKAAKTARAPPKECPAHVLQVWTAGQINVHRDCNMPAQQFIHTKVAVTKLKIQEANSCISMVCNATQCLPVFPFFVGSTGSKERTQIWAGAQPLPNISCSAKGKQRLCRTL